MSKSLVMGTVDALLKLPNPFDRTHRGFMFIKCGNLISINMNIYRCNICMLKLLGEDHFFDHCKSLRHKATIEKHVAALTMKPMPNTQQTSRTTNNVTNKNAALLELNNEYKMYFQYPNLHPKFSTATQIFYAQNHNQLSTDDFKKYWHQCMQTYYHEDVMKVINTYESNSKPMQNELVNGQTSKSTAVPGSDNNKIASAKICDKTLSIDDESKSISESGSESDADDDFNLTSRLRAPMSDQPLVVAIQSAIKLASASISNINTGHLANNVVSTKNQADKKKPLSNQSKPLAKETFTANDVNNAVKEAVLSMLQLYGMNAADLSDESLVNYIQFVINHVPYERFLKKLSTN